MAASIPTQRGGVAIALQPAFENYTSPTWTSFSLAQHAINAEQDMQTLPQEIGGIALPQGAYKGGYAVVGRVAFIVRLVDVGWLLLACAGAQLDSSALSGVNPNQVGTHKFSVKSTDHFDLPWLTVRRSMDGGARLDEYKDCRVVGMEFTLGNSGFLVCEMTFLGCKGAPVTGTIAKPTDQKFALSVLGGIEVPIGNTTKEFQQARLSFVNIPAQPQQERIIGKYELPYITILSRRVSCNLIYKWANRDLYDQLTANATGGSATAWSPTVYKTGLKFYAASADKILTTPYSFAFESAAGNVAFTHQPLGAEANDLVRMGVMGMLLHEESADPFTLTLVNNKLTRYDTGAALT